MFSTFVKKFAAIALPMALLLTGTPSFASDTISAKEKALITTKFANVRTELKVTDVEKTDINGMYLVHFSKQGSVFYIPEGDYFFTGDLLQINQSRFVNVKETRLQEPRKKAIAAIDPNEMIIYPATGKKKASITVFTDVDCGYCRKLHNEMAQINGLGIEVKYIAYPRAGIDSPVYNKMVSAWCSTDKRDALNKLKSGQPVFTAPCEDNPIAKQYTLGGRLGVKGTPAIVLESGELLPGYLPADKLAEAIGL